MAESPQEAFARVEPREPRSPGDARGVCRGTSMRSGRQTSRRPRSRLERELQNGRRWLSLVLAMRASGSPRMTLDPHETCPRIVVVSEGVLRSCDGCRADQCARREHRTTVLGGELVPGGNCWDTRSDRVGQRRVELPTAHGADGWWNSDAGTCMSSTSRVARSVGSGSCTSGCSDACNTRTAGRCRCIWCC